jgi:predicted nucleotidyltransferase component of viral defense system
MKLIEKMLAQYNAENSEALIHALREIMQKIAVAGLYRGGFFRYAAFYGGSCLRLFHGLDRYSEDLDFTLLRADGAFSLENYFQNIAQEFTSLGIDVTIQKRKKSVESPVESAFLKSNTIIHTLELTVPMHRDRTVKIKLEADTQPPLKFQTEEKLLLQPFSFYVRCLTLPSLYAGKLHALLFRKWKNRVKGRDWYDWEWYVRHQIPVDLTHLRERAVQSGDWEENVPFDQPALQSLLLKHINDVDFEAAADDVRRFILNPDLLQIWSVRYFSDLAEHIKIM